MVNIGDISKPSGGVTPAKTNRSTKATNKVEAVEVVSPTDKVSIDTKSKEKPDKEKQKESKTTHQKTAKASDIDETTATYDEHGQKHNKNQIDYSV
ncbi:hypothetical protein [Aliikangiella sp. IMCC44359]|uniref:hypothetical protein n=1 Tax=Aliikangiella sp. IMCC44359 TaxID=3459125 RepID=UPI00403ACBD1